MPGKPLGKKAVCAGPVRFNPSADPMRRFASVAKEQIPDEQKFYKGAVAMTMRAYFARPLGHFKRHGKGLRATAPADYIQKPDTDNILKFVGDCLSGMAYHDDA